jgi:hypothetical protein
MAAKVQAALYAGNPVINFADLGPQVGHDLLVLIAAVKTSLAEVTPLSGAGYPGYEATAFRLRFADGLVLKGRRFRTDVQAATVEHVSRHLDHRGFPRVLARSGSALLTEWIEGRPLGDADFGLVHQCGVLQGYMHSLPVPADSPYQPRDTIHDWHARLKRRLLELARARVLDESEAGRAFDVALGYAPDAYDFGFVHRDFCAENVVVRPSGEVSVVDNETLAVDAYDYDLGRTWYRWPMSGAQRRAYLDGYQSYRSLKDFLAHFPYWTITAIVEGAVFRLRRQANAAEAPVTRLRRLLRDLEQGHSADSALFQS